jgi:hypothetical protein
MEFTKILMLEYLKKFIIFFKKKINTGVFWKFLQDLTANPNGMPLNETFRNLDTSFWDKGTELVNISNWGIQVSKFPT